MGEGSFIVAAWLLAILALIALRHRLKRGSRHFAYEPRAELLRRALAERRPVRIVYWSQASHRWLHRTVMPEELAAGHLRARDKRTDHTRKYEVTRMRKIRMGTRVVRTPLAWHVPLAILSGSLAVALSTKALLDESEHKPVNIHQSPPLPVHWLQNLPPAPSSEPAAPVVAEASSFSLTQGVDASGPLLPAPSLTEPEPAKPDEPPTHRWGVVVRDAGRLSSTELRRAFEFVFVYAKPQALYWARQTELGSQPTVWQGSYDAATNYVRELCDVGVPAELKPPKGKGPQAP